MISWRRGQRLISGWRSMGRAAMWSRRKHLSARRSFQGSCCMLAMDVWCFSKSTARIDLEKHQTRLHYWGISLCNFGESPLQFWVFLLYTKQCVKEDSPEDRPFRSPGILRHACIRGNCFWITTFYSMKGSV